MATITHKELRAHFSRPSKACRKTVTSTDVPVGRPGWALKQGLNLYAATHPKVDMDAVDALVSARPAWAGGE